MSNHVVLVLTWRRTFPSPAAHLVETAWPPPGTSFRGAQLVRVSVVGHALQAYGWSGLCMLGDVVIRLAPRPSPTPRPEPT